MSQLGRYSRLFQPCPAVVVEPPTWTSEQYIRGRGGVVGVTHLRPDGRYGTAPLGRFELDTEYRRGCDFWVRYVDGREELIRMRREVPPVRAGHRLTVIAAERGGRPPVLVGFVNHTTGRHLRLASAAAVLRRLGLPVEERWREPLPGGGAAGRRRREAQSRQSRLIACGAAGMAVGWVIASVGGAVAGPAAVLVGGLLGIGGMMVVGCGVAVWAGGETQLPPAVWHGHSYAAEFDAEYRQFWEGVSEWGRPQPPDAIDGGR